MSNFISTVRVLVNQEKYQDATQLLADFLNYGTKQLQEQIKRLRERIRQADREPSSVGKGKFNPAAALNAFLDYLEQKETAQLRFLSHLTLAAEKFSTGEWQEARLNYELAGELHQPVYAIPIAEIKRKSRLCDEAMIFNQYIETANDFFAIKSWENAAKSYQQAIKMIREDFHYDPTELHNTLALCHRGVRFDQNMDLAKGYESQRIWGEAKMAYFRALELHDEAFNVRKQEIQSAISFCEENQQQKKRLQFPLPLRHGTMVLNLGLVAAIIFISIQFTRNKSEEKRGNVHITYPEKSLVSDTISFSTNGASALAIIPFCNNIKDYSLSAKVYSDAISAIKTSGNTEISLLSENPVLNSIKKLGLVNADFCEEKEALRIAEDLGVENIIMGRIVSLPDNQLRIVCQLLYVPTRQYSREIVLTDRDINRLRQNLIMELRQVFE
ncbi:MAG: hypothetical protein R3D00_12300 [Bacteroidia bacterium]